MKEFIARERVYVKEECIMAKSLKEAQKKANLWYGNWNVWEV